MQHRIAAPQGPNLKSECFDYFRESGHESSGLTPREVQNNLDQQTALVGIYVNIQKPVRFFVSGSIDE